MYCRTQNLLFRHASPVVPPRSLYFESNIFNMMVGVCFSGRETCTQHWEIWRAEDKHGCLNETGQVPAMAFERHGLPPGSWGRSIIGLVLEMCFDQKPSWSLMLGIWALYPSCLFTFYRVSAFWCHSRTAPVNTSEFQTAAGAELGFWGILWVYDGPPSQLFLAACACPWFPHPVEQSVEGALFNKRVLVVWTGGMWGKDAFLSVFFSSLN